MHYKITELTSQDCRIHAIVAKLNMDLKVELLLDNPSYVQHEVLITYQEFEITRCTNFRTIEISYLQWKLLLIEVFLKAKYSNFFDFSVHFFAFWFSSFLYLFTRYILFVVQTFLSWVIHMFNIFNCIFISYSCYYFIICGFTEMKFRF